MNDLPLSTHELLDDKLKGISGLPDLAFKFTKGMLLSTIITECRQAYSKTAWPIDNAAAHDMEACDKFLMLNQEVQDLLREANCDGKYAKIRNRPEFHQEEGLSGRGMRSAFQAGKRVAAHKILSDAYTQPFRGSAAHDFVGFLLDTDQRVKSGNENLYAKVLSIVQSSGTGKSRMLTEAGNHPDIFTLPICLRCPDDLGYPPSDKVVYTYFLNSPPVDDPLDLISSSHLSIACFIGAAYATMLKWLKMVQTECGTTEELHDRWYDFMEGKNRSGRDSFFLEVVALAHKWRNNAQPPKPQTTDQQALNIIEHAKTCYDTHTKAATNDLMQFVSSLNPQKKTLLVTYFDEAHCSGIPLWVLHCLLRNQLRSTSMWYVFIGTKSSIAYFHPTPEDMRFLRLRREMQYMLPPYIALGFDQNVIRGDQAPVTITMHDIQSIEHLSKYGRPMWNAQFRKGEEEDLIGVAASKLMGAMQFEPKEANHVLAILSQRLCIDLVMASSEAIQLARNGVSDHMRLLTGSSNDMKTFYTCSPTEPILALAAFNLVYGDKNSGHRCLAQVLDTFGQHLCKAGLVEKGLLRELAACTLLLLARDEVAPAKPNGFDHVLLEPVLLLDFLDKLFGNEEWCDGHRTGFIAAFKNTYVNFTHWIVTKDALPNQPSPQYLANLWARGGALQCCFNQESIDLLIPTYTGSIAAGEVFNVANLSAVVVQVMYEANAHTKAGLALRPTGIPRDLSQPLPYLAIAMVLEFGNNTFPRTLHKKLEVTSPTLSTGSDYNNLVDTWMSAMQCLQQYKLLEREPEIAGQEKELQKKVDDAQIAMDNFNRFTVSARGVSSEVYGILQEAEIETEFASLLRVTMPPSPANPNQDIAVQHMRPFERLGDTSAHMAWMSVYTVEHSEEEAANNLMEEDESAEGMC